MKQASATARPYAPPLPRWMAAVVVLAVAAAYANSLRGAFVMDDFQVIVHNEPLQRLWPPTMQFWASPVSGVWARPVAALSLAINYAIGRDYPFNYHVTNVALHAMCALLLLGLVRRTLLLPQFRPWWSPRAAATAALIVALLWAIHPLTTDTVTYLSGRPELLFGLFLLMALYARVRAEYARRRTTWLICAIAACALGMGCKEVMVVAPIIVLLYDGVFLTTSPLAALRRGVRFYAALAATWLILAALLLRPELADRGALHGFSSWDYLKTQAGVIVHYFRLAFWPRPLVIDYYDWPVARQVSDVLPQGLFVLTLLGLTTWGLIRRHWLGFAGAWVFLTLAPTSSIYPIWIEVATERRMYMPLAAIVAAAVIGAHLLLQRLNQPALWRVAGLAGGFAALGMIALTIRRNEDFRDAVTLTRVTVEQRPGNSRAWIAHGEVLAFSGELESAMGAFEQAVRADERNPRAYLARGRLFARLGDRARAVEDFTAVIELDSTLPEPHYELGKLQAAQGESAAAEASFRRSLELFPRWRDPRLWLAGVLMQQNRLEEAEALLKETAEMYPGFPAVEQALRGVRGARENRGTGAPPVQ